MPAANKNPALRNHEQNRNYPLPARLFLPVNKSIFQKGTDGNFQVVKGRKSKQLFLFSK